MMVPIMHYKIVARYYYYLGTQPGVGVTYLGGTYPAVRKQKVEYLLPLCLETLLKDEMPMVAWTLLELEANHDGTRSP